MRLHAQSPFFLRQAFLISLSVCPPGGADHLTDDVVQGYGRLSWGRPWPLCCPAGIWTCQCWCKLHWLKIRLDKIIYLFINTYVCLFVFQRLNALAALVRGQLPILHRNIITALITIDVHARDTVTDLVRQKVQYCSVSAEGQRQLSSSSSCLYLSFHAVKWYFYNNF